MTCETRLNDATDGLRCVRPDGHPDGCVFRSGGGSELSDKHGEDGHG
jgi:hypothetical protein